FYDRSPDSLILFQSSRSVTRSCNGYVADDRIWAAVRCARRCRCSRRAARDGDEHAHAAGAGPRARARRRC
ncbi:hypothetical protein CA831_12590, partial [Burkholderia multivorans]